MTDDEADFINSIAALDTSMVNGFMVLIGRLKRKGVLNNEDLSHIQEAMYKPLNLPDNAMNMVVQTHQQKLDDLFSVYLNEI